MHEHLPSLPFVPYYNTGATAFTDRLLGRTENCWKNLSFALFTAISYYVATCHHAVCAMGVCQALALFGTAKQAMGAGKSGPVETGLNRPVPMAL